MQEGERKKNVVVTILMENDAMVNILGRAFDDKEEVSIVDLVGARSELAKKFIDDFQTDIVIISQDTFSNMENRSKVYEMIEQNGDTHYVTIYNDENVEKMKKMNEILLERELPVTMCKVEDEFDCEILAQTIQGIINGKLQARKREDALLSKINDEFDRGEQ